MITHIGILFWRFREYERDARLEPSAHDMDITSAARQHGLDPTLVKAYAADFCGTPTLKEASRNLVESFVSHLETAARENRDGLVYKLNS